MFELLNILLVEHDAFLGSKLKSKLKSDRFNLKWLGSLQAAFDISATEKYDIYIVNATLPDGSGMEYIHKLSKTKLAPITICILDEDSLSKRVEAFKFGADDVMTKPVHYPELVARIQAILRRCEKSGDSRIIYGDLMVDLEARVVTQKGTVVNLSAKEFAILKILIKNPGFIYSKQQLEDKIYEWGGDLGSNATEVHISHLRKKLGKNLITTFRNMGYVIKKLSDSEPPKTSTVLGVDSTEKV